MAHWRRLAAASATAALGSSGLGVMALSHPVVWPLVLAAAAFAVWLGRSVRARRREAAETLAALADAVLAGLVAAGRQDLGAAQVSVEPDPAGGWLAVLRGASDDAARCWADALSETLGPLGTPRWLVAVRRADRAWRVPAAVGSTKLAAAAFVRAFRSRVPGVELVRAGTPRATELVLAAARHRPDEIERTLRWR